MARTKRNRTYDEIFDDILVKFDIEYDGENRDEYVLLCKQIKESLPNNWHSHVNRYIPIIIKRKLSGNLLEYVKTSISIKAVTLDKFIYVYGEDWGLEKWESYKNRQAETNTFEYKSKKYGMSEEEFKAYNKSRAVTKENLLERHGEEIGNQVWNNYVEQQKLTKSREYMIAKFGESRYNEICKEKSHNIDTYISRYGEDSAQEKLEKFFENLRPKTSYSGVSQEFFDEIDFRLGYTGNPTISYYASKNKEFVRYSNEIRGCYKFDYTIPSLQLIVEFDGDWYHMNPKIYNPSDYNAKKGMTSVEIWNIDAQKKRFVNSIGYDIINIWESDYYDNKEYTIERVVEYAKNKELLRTMSGGD